MKRKSKKDECPICLQNIKTQIKTNCNHIFCDICILRHLNISNTCPMCRAECYIIHITCQITERRKKTIIKLLKYDPFETKQDEMINEIQMHNEEVFNYNIFIQITREVGNIYMQCITFIFLLIEAFIILNVLFCIAKVVFISLIT